MVRTRKITFEKVKIPDRYDIWEYWVIEDKYIQKDITNYCLQNNLILKSLEIKYGKVKLKVKCNKKQIHNFYIYLITNCNHYATNFKY